MRATAMSRSAERVEHLGGEVQSGGGRRHRARLVSVDGLVALGVGQRRGDVRGQGHVAVALELGLGDQQSHEARLTGTPTHLDEGRAVGVGQDLAVTELGAGAHQRLPHAVADGLHEQDLGGTAGRPPHPQAGGDDPGLVHHDEVAGPQQPGEVVHVAVLGCPARPAIDQEASGVAPFQRRLGDRRRREVVVVVRQEHPNRVRSGVMATASATPYRTDSVAAGDDSFDLDVWVPASGHGPGIVLFQEIFGVGPYIRSVAERLARLGYVVAAPDVFWRLQRNWHSDHDEAGLQASIGLVSNFDFAQGVADCVAALQPREGAPGSDRRRRRHGLLPGRHPGLVRGRRRRPRRRHQLLRLRRGRRPRPGRPGHLPGHLPLRRQRPLPPQRAGRRHPGRRRRTAPTSRSTCRPAPVMPSTTTRRRCSGTRRPPPRRGSARSTSSRAHLPVS